MMVSEIMVPRLEFGAAIFLRALAPHTALLLVGDPEQLPSVEAGALLGDLLHGARQAARSAKGGPLSESVIHLTKVYRSGTAILEFAAAVRDGDMNRLNNAVDGGAVSVKPLRTADATAAILAEEYRRMIRKPGCLHCPHTAAPRPVGSRVFERENIP